MKFFKIDKKEPFQNTIVGILLLGIIGSALWEKIISPLSTFIFSNLSNFFSNIFADWYNSLFEQIANSYYDSSSFFITTLFYLIGCFIFLKFVLIYLPSAKWLIRIFKLSDDDDIEDDLEFEDDDSETDSKPKGKLSLILHMVFDIVVILLFVFIFGFALGETTYVSHTQSALLSNIEIVSPYIEDTEYKTLKSNFHSMDCEDDFTNLIQDLSDIATEYNLELKEVQQPFS